MAPREELVSSAVSFLQDSSVASAPLDKKVAFLQSKNLTQEEIDIAFSRTGQSSTSVAAVTQNAAPVPQYYPPSPVGQSYGYGWQQQQQLPPELPKRDWRDWFIMATVAGGVGYGLYFVAKRYITPLISPPTPPQLQQDKESIDAQFNQAFSLLDQLSTDTTILKSAEEARTQKLDTAIRDVEDIIEELKSLSRRRDDDMRRVSDEVRSLKDNLPKAVEGERKGNEKRLIELSTELRSLKVLLNNRLGSAGAPASRPSAEAPRSGVTDTAGTSVRPAEPSTATTSPVPVENPSSVTTRSPATPFSQLGKPASIPAWQMAAANKNKTASVSDESESTN